MADQEELVAELNKAKKKKKKPLAPFLCRLIGILILAAVIISCGLVTVPKLMGYEVYHVVSGSMAPKIPVGSLVYIEEAEPASVEKGQIIAFQSGSSVIVHRVVDNWVFEGKFTTKGDANDEEDLSDINYDQLIGVMKYHIPRMGQMLMILDTTMGKMLVLIFAACGALLNIIAGRLSSAD